MPQTIILGENAQKYLPNLDKNNAFGIHYKNNILIHCQKQSKLLTEPLPKSMINLRA